MTLPILAIDPGPEQSAIVIWDGVSVSKDIVANQKVLDLIYNFGGSFAFSRVFIERIASYGMPVGAEVFMTCFVSGRFWQAAVTQAFPVYLIPRLAVKLHLCGSARAKDSNVRQALCDRFGNPTSHRFEPGKTKKIIERNPITHGMHDDIWAAFGLAVTGCETDIEKYKAP